MLILQELSYYVTIKTTIGDLALCASKSHLLSICFGRAANSDWTPFLRDVATQIDHYLGGTLKVLDIPYILEGTPFQKRVWQELTTIPYGQTISYKELARCVGSPKACRAVALANRSNPLPILLPCHRVIRSSGELGGYFGGCKIKKHLLDLEDVSGFWKKEAST